MIDHWPKFRPFKINDLPHRGAKTVGTSGGDTAHGLIQRFFLLTEGFFPRNLIFT
jgi:hypothetical protein